MYDSYMLFSCIDRNSSSINGKKVKVVEESEGEEVLEDESKSYEDTCNNFIQQTVKL